MRRRRGRAVARALALVVLLPGAAHAGFADWNGHLGIGYAKVFASRPDPVAAFAESPRQMPAGSLSMAAGADYPLTRSLRLGVGIGYHLLGSQVHVRGSLFANVDYSVFDAALLAHWTPPAGPVGLVSFGPALVSAHADLSTGGGGAAFSDLAVAETAPGIAVDATFISRRPAPVRMGLELGTRIGFLENENWILATARVAFHY